VREFLSVRARAVVKGVGISDTSALQIPETHYARSGDVSIAYQVVGEGPFDVVLVPAFSHVELAWTMSSHHRVIPRRLASFARLIFFDRRGMGMSDRTGLEMLETRMDDVRAVMDAAGSERAALFGMMDGGALSMLFAATYPERTTALVLFSAWARTMWAADYPLGISEERRREVVDARMRLFFGSREDAVAVVRGYLGPEPSDQEVLADVDYLRRAAGSPRTFDTYLQMYNALDVRQALPAIRVPTLVVHGTVDVPDPAQSARYLADRISGARTLELTGEHRVPGRAALDRALDETKSFLYAAWDGGAWEEPEPDRVLATVLFTDIVGSTDRAARLGDRDWRQLLGRHHELVRRQLVRFRGKEVDTAGDGFLASFDGPARAIRCAEAVVEGVHALGLEVRAGLHTGECELFDGKVAGIAVHTGARVASQAAPGEVLVSSTVKDLVAGSGLTFQDRGTHKLKGVPGEWRLYAVEA